MADHDQRFKTMIKELFDPYLALFHPSWYALLAMGQVEWLEQEQFPDPPEGEKQTADLVTKVPTLQLVPPIREGEEATNTLIVHLEIE